MEHKIICCFSGSNHVGWPGVVLSAIAAVFKTVLRAYQYFPLATHFPCFLEGLEQFSKIIPYVLVILM